MNVQYVVPVPVIVRDSKVLLVYRHSSSVSKCLGKWQFGGSGTRFGQSVGEAVIANVKRMLGVDVTVREILGMIGSTVSDLTDGSGRAQCFIIPVICETDTTDFAIDKSKLREAKWFSLAEIEELHAKGELVDQNDLEIARMVLKSSLQVQP